MTASTGPDACEGDSGVRAPGSVVPKFSAVHREAMARLWADPEFRARNIALNRARQKALWADPAYRERARGFNRDDHAYRWQHIASGRVVVRTKAEMREEYGLTAGALDDLAAGRSKTSRGWRLAPRSLLGEAPRWIFP